MYCSILNAGNEQVQEWLVKYDIISFILECMTIKTHNSIVVKYGLALIHPLLVNSDKTQLQFLEKKGVKVIVACLYTHLQDRRIVRTSFSLLSDFVCNDNERNMIAKVII